MRATDAAMPISQRSLRRRVHHAQGKALRLRLDRVSARLRSTRARGRPEAVWVPTSRTHRTLIDARSPVRSSDGHQVRWGSIWSRSRQTPTRQPPVGAGGHAMARCSRSSSRRGSEIRTTSGAPCALKRWIDASNDAARRDRPALTAMSDRRAAHSAARATSPTGDVRHDRTPRRRCERRRPARRSS